MAEIPDWLRPADPARYYSEAYSQGAAVAEANARLKQEANESQLRITLAQQQQERQNAIAQAKLETVKAYNQQRIELRAQQLGQLQKVADAKAATAAKLLDAQDKFNRMVASGMTPKDAMFASGLGTAKLAAEYDKSQTQTDIANTKAKIDMARLNQANNKGVLTGSTVTTDPVTGVKTTSYNRQPLNGSLPPSPTADTGGGFAAPPITPNAPVDPTAAGAPLGQAQTDLSAGGALPPAPVVPAQKVIRFKRDGNGKLVPDMGDTEDADSSDN